MKKRGRMLLKMSEIDVARDLLFIELDINQEDAKEKLGYYVDLIDWKDYIIDLQFNFSDPLLISQGSILDKIYVKIRDRTWFVARETGEVV